MSEFEFELNSDSDNSESYWKTCIRTNRLMDILEANIRDEFDRDIFELNRDTIDNFECNIGSKYIIMVMRDYFGDVDDEPNVKYYLAPDIRCVLKFTWDVRRNLCKNLCKYYQLKRNLEIFEILLKAKEAVKCLNNTVFSFMDIYIDFDKDSTKPLSDIPPDTEMAGNDQEYTLLYAAVCEKDFELANLMIDSGVNPNVASCETFYSSNGKHNKYRLPLEAANYFKSIGYKSTELDKLIINLTEHGAKVINEMG